MNLVNSLAAACEVARQGSFAGAARVLGLSAPSLTRLVAELEAHLGASLFVRTTRNVSMTEEGALLVERAGQILDEIDELRFVVAERDRLPRGHLRISAVIAFGTELLPMALAEFGKTYPEITIELDVSNRRADLVEEHIDVAIRIGSADGLEASALKARRIFQQRLVFVAPPDVASAYPGLTEPSDLRGVPLVRFVTGSFGRSHRLEGRDGAEDVFDLPGTLTVSSPVAARNALLAGGYVGLIADYLVRDALATGRLVTVLDGWSTRPQPIFAVYAARDPMPTRQRVFLDFLVDWFARAA